MTSVMTRSAARILLMPLLMVAFGVLIKGYVDVGDGFSAGVIASLALIIQGVAFGAEEFERTFVVRLAPLLTFAGLFLALLTAFLPVFFGDPIFLHRPAAGSHAKHVGSLELITPVAFDVGVFLVVIGCCVGTMGAVARESMRRAQDEARAEARRAHREGEAR